MNVRADYVEWPKLISWQGQKNYMNKGHHVTEIMPAQLVLESLETGRTKTDTKKVFTVMIQVWRSGVCCVTKASWVKPASTITLASPTLSQNLFISALFARKSSAMNKVLRGIKAQVAVTLKLMKTEPVLNVNYVSKLFLEKMPWPHIRQKFTVFTQSTSAKLKKSSVKMMEVWSAAHVAKNSLETMPEKKMKTHAVNKCKSAVEVHQCEECGKPFGQLADLKTHIKMKHKKEYSIHSCKYCDFLSDYKADSLINTDMKRHIRTCHPTIWNNN